MKLLLKFKFLYLIPVFSLFVAANKTQAQDLKFAERLIVGTSLTYINHPNPNIRNIYFHELTWNKNIAVNLNRSFYFGLHHLNIYTRGSSALPNPDYRASQYLAGAFLQYDFLPEIRERLFLELSWSYGNYCTCGYDDPYRREGLRYLGGGVGGDIPINNFLSLDLAFNLYRPVLLDVDYITGYTQYTVGLSFDIFRR
jgi:hypothetical protein